MTGDISGLYKLATTKRTTNFDIGVADILVHLQKRDTKKASELTDTLRSSVARSLSAVNTSSMQACHDSLLKLHCLHEIRSLSDVLTGDAELVDYSKLMATLDSRLAVVGSYISDKQYVLGIRRAVMFAAS